MAEMKKQAKNGANRCPHCGATDVKLDVKSGKLKCNYCRSLFENKAINAHGGVENLKGDIIGEGAVNIVPDEKIIVTLKCPACGAEVVINTDESVSARCHWCRHTLSLNEKMPNGAVPDLVLPFQTEKTVAEEKIREFVKKRQFFAHPVFKREFAPENVMGVYLPYMIVDVNAHARMEGEAEHLIRKYTSGSGNHKTTYYDAEAFAVTRDFDLLVDDLTIESSSKRLQQDVRVNTNNVINAIMPFDTENCVDWNPNYLQGFASERRDTNIDDLREQLGLKVGDIARYKVKESMEYYDRGAKWTMEKVETKGTKWKAAYLPVWLYSYLQNDGDKKMLHYVAVNARTGETMGSVPINKTRLTIVAAIIEMIGIAIGWQWIKFWLGVDSDDDDNPFWLGLAGFTPGFIFYWIQSARYRNMNARHKHEAETMSEIKNLKKTDASLGRRNRLRSSSIDGRNDSVVKGVVAKAGERMMGEKMANFLGIGRMAGSKASQTAAGQATEAKIQKNKKTVSTVIKIMLIAFLIPSIIMAVGVVVGIMSSRTGSRSGNETSLRESDLQFSVLSDKVKGVADTEHYLYSPIVDKMAFYNRNEESDYSVYNLKTTITRKAFSASTMEIVKDDLSRSKLITDAGKKLDEAIVDSGVVRKRMMDLFEDSESNKFSMRLYTGRSKSGDSDIFCDLREELLNKSEKLGNGYKITLKCVEIDKEVVEENNIKI